MYNIREKVSDQAGKKLKVFRAMHDMTVAQALDDILLNLPVQTEVKQND